jgi:hypothetical protein
MTYCTRSGQVWSPCLHSNTPVCSRRTNCAASVRVHCAIITFSQPELNATPLPLSVHLRAVLGCTEACLMQTGGRSQFTGTATGRIGATERNGRAATVGVQRDTSQCPGNQMQSK